MRKKILFVLLMILSLSSASAELVPIIPYYTGYWNITAKQLTNHSVGHSWTKYFEIDSIKYDKECIYQYLIDDEISFYARIKEHDSKPDIGTKRISYSPTEEQLVNGFSIDFKINVKENNGKYKGNTSTWKIIIEWVPIEEEATNGTV